MLFIYQFLLPVLLVVGAEQNIQAADYHLLEPNYLAMEYRDYEAYSNHVRNDSRVSYRDSYLSPLDEDITYGLGLYMDYNLLRYRDVWRVKWDNEWFFDSASSHVRHVGWRFHLGLNIRDKVELGYKHMSRHVLEDTREERFPVNDSLYLRFIIYSR